MFDDFKTICIENGFRFRGKACFRVIGDGVLQVLKYNKSRIPYNPILELGLFSLYGSIESGELTSLGCIPRYWIYNLAHPYEAAAEFLLIGPEMEKQMGVLKEKGFHWLDTIASQSALADAICKLDIATFNSICWNDMDKFAPFLKCGDFANAEKVIQAIIEQYLSAWHSKSEGLKSETWEAHTKDMLAFKELLEMACSRNEKKINEYLMENYDTNLKKVKFCMG